MPVLPNVVSARVGLLALAPAWPVTPTEHFELITGWVRDEHAPRSAAAEALAYSAS